MTDASQRVWPRQALKADRDDTRDFPWRLTTEFPDMGWELRITDAGFAHNFVPADRLDRLLAAVGVTVDVLTARFPDPLAVPWPEDVEDAYDALCAAWRDYRGDE